MLFIYELNNNYFVGERGLEPPRDCSHTALNRARLLHPPKLLCSGGDLNSHEIALTAP